MLSMEALGTCEELLGGSTGRVVRSIEERRERVVPGLADNDRGSKATLVQESSYHM